MVDLLSTFTAGGHRRASFSVAPPTPRPLDPVEGLWAGASEVDITPPPGMPKAGYSANAVDGSGFRTRLRARVLHLRTSDASVAIVQCDLLGGSSVVHHLVAHAVAERTDIPLAGIVIGATHTHAGPGQFLGTDFYNRFASNRSGFDPAWTSFLVERIASGVVDAHDSRRPARMAVGTTDVWGWTRNRSQAPHVHNHSVADKRTEPQRKFVSINPELHLVRVDAAPAGGPDGAPYEPLAATVVFSVHGTGISMKAPEYNADLWAYLCGELRHRIETSTGHRPVVGAIEGTHADVAPAIRPGLAGYVEAERIGRGVGAEAAALYDRLGDHLRGDVPIGCGLREVDLDSSPAIAGITLPRRPAVGAALVAGAHENVTPVIHRIPPFRPGTRKPWRTSHPQGAKWVLGTRWGQALVLPLPGFPRRLPVAVVRLGDAALVGLPFEVTTESGRRIAAEVAAAPGLRSAGVGRVIVSSVANEYSGYVATAEEYELQHYEGGHTLYGPDTQRFLAAHAAELADAVVGQGTVSQVPGERRWHLRIKHYLPGPPPSTATSGGPASPVDRRFSGPARFVDPTRTVDGYWEASWVDVAPGGLRWHEPLARVEACDPGGAWVPATRQGRVVDDQGWWIELTHLGPAAGERGAHRYRIRWFDPAFRAGRRHRFVLVANGDRPEVRSDPFD